MGELGRVGKESVHFSWSKLVANWLPLLLTALLPAHDLGPQRVWNVLFLHHLTPRDHALPVLSGIGSGPHYLSHPYEGKWTRGLGLFKN